MKKLSAILIVIICIVLCVGVSGCDIQHAWYDSADEAAADMWWDFGGNYESETALGTLSFDGCELSVFVAKSGQVSTILFKVREEDGRKYYSTSSYTTLALKEAQDEESGASDGQETTGGEDESAETPDGTLVVKDGFMYQLTSDAVRVFVNGTEAQYVSYSVTLNEADYILTLWYFVGDTQDYDLRFEAADVG